MGDCGDCGDCGTGGDFFFFAAPSSGGAGRIISAGEAEEIARRKKKDRELRELLFDKRLKEIRRQQELKEKSETVATSSGPTTPSQRPQKPSLGILCEDIEAATSSLELIKNKFTFRDWQPLLVGLSSIDFAIVVSRVHLPREQKSVASLLAKHNAQFSCQHVVSILRRLTQQERNLRVDIVTQCLRYCRDVQDRHDTIRNDLSENEQAISHSVFEDVLSGKVSASYEPPPPATKMSSQVHFSAYQPEASAPVIPKKKVSLNAFWQDFKAASSGRIHIVNARLGDCDWRAILSKMDALDYGITVAYVQSYEEQTQVASALAKQQLSFSCRHVASALRRLPNGNRVEIVRQLLPYCQDIITGSQMIMDELSDEDTAAVAIDIARAATGGGEGNM